MSVACINQLSESLAAKICQEFLTGTRVRVCYDANGDLIGNFDSAYDCKGLYGFLLSKNGVEGIVYVGKSECDKRLRQHLTRKNKDGTRLATSVKTKHSDIRKAINDGYTVELALYKSPDFTKSSLACLEIEAINTGISTLYTAFPNIASWNRRIG